MWCYFARMLIVRVVAPNYRLNHRIGTIIQMSSHIAVAGSHRLARVRSVVVDEVQRFEPVIWQYKYAPAM